MSFYEIKQCKYIIGFTRTLGYSNIDQVQIIHSKNFERLRIFFLTDSCENRISKKCIFTSQEDRIMQIVD